MLSTEVDEAYKKVLEQYRIQLEGLAKHGADCVKNTLLNYLNDIKILANYPELLDLFYYRKKNPKGYAKNGKKLKDRINQYFLKIARERPDIDMIRAFWEDGNVFVGVKLGKIDKDDYKGDKKWFKDNMDKSKVKLGEYYISPLSIARATNSPAVRYITPIEVEGERLGVFIINYNASAITRDVLQLQVPHGYSFMIDKKYVNAEGKVFTQGVYLAHPTEKICDENGKSVISPEKLVNDKGFLNYTDNGKLWWAAYHRVEMDDREWYVIVTIPDSLIEERVKEINREKEEMKKRIAKLLNSISAVAEGDLTLKVEDEGKDEIAEIAKAVEKTRIELKKMIENLREAINRVSATSQELAASAEEINASTEQISSTTQQIATGAQNQAKQVEAGKQQIILMADKIDEISKKAGEARTLSEKSTKLAEEGGKAAEQALNKMDEIYEASVNSSSTIKALGERNKQIEKIVSLITNIADQTNLLALNAAIEAARAGEHGRGFAVVAEEVRKLAEESRKAAEQIGDLIRSIQIETDKAVEEIASSTEEVHKGAEIVKNALEALDKIISSIKETNTAIEEISTKADEIDTLAKDVRKVVEEIATITEETAAATEEASAATEELTASMQELTTSAQELANIANKLQELAETFKIDKQEGFSQQRAIAEVTNGQ